jgi:hypothetical protein
MFFFVRLARRGRARILRAGRFANAFACTGVTERYNDRSLGLVQPST